MDAIVRPNNNPVSDMKAPMSGFINDLNKITKTMSRESMFG